MNSLSCEQVRTQVSALLAGAVEAAEEGALEAHLAGCAACRLQTQQFVWQDRVLAELSAQSMEPELTGRVHRALTAAVRSETDAAPVADAPGHRAAPIPGSQRNTLLSARRLRFALAAGLAAGVIAAVTVWSGTRSRPVVAYLDQVQGEVHLLSARSKVLAAAGQPIHAGEGIETQGLGSFAVVKYADDTSLRLGADTTVREFGGDKPSDPSGGRKDAFLTRGLVRAEIAGQTSDQPFRLETPAAQLSVWDTRFVVSSDADATQVDVDRGQVELVRRSDGKVVQVGQGCYARAGSGEDMVSKVPVWQELFNARDLSGWRVVSGRWRVEDGALTGDAAGARNARIKTERCYGDFELTCQQWLPRGYAELQVRNYGWFFELKPADGGWREMRIIARGRTFECLADGRSEPTLVDNGPGPHQEDKPAGPLQGVIGIYVRPGSLVRLKDIRLREFRSGGTPVASRDGSAGRPGSDLPITTGHHLLTIAGPAPSKPRNRDG